MKEVAVKKKTYSVDLESLSPRNFIIIKGARVHNLKNIDVAIPRNKLIVITGLSGSGKSSLAFDTLFAEGQRMYVESLSSYARQFLGRMEKPEVDYIKGVSPAIAIEQKANSRNPRSTVGTTTEIYDYLKLLFARVGHTISPLSGVEVKKNTVTDVIDWIFKYEEGTRFMVLAPFKLKHDRKPHEELQVLLQKGFTRLYLNGEVVLMEELLEKGTKAIPAKAEAWILIDRNTVNKVEEDAVFRVADSVQTAFAEGEGDCRIVIPDKVTEDFCDRFEADGIIFEEPTANFFSFNNPYGACRTCEGFGHVMGIDEDLVIPDKSLSVYEGAIAAWRGEKMNEWQKPLIKNGIKFDFPIHRAVQDLSPEEKQLLWDGNKYFEGLTAFFAYLETQTYKIQYRVMLSRFRGRTVCPDCRGTRLRKDASYVKVAEKSITDIVLMSVDHAVKFFNTVKLHKNEAKIAERLLKEIINRLSYLEKVGLGYLTLNRLTASLSGGEFQRIKLATSLGSALVGSMYVLDEPSIGLHPRDTGKLVEVLKMLRDMGNTVIVVEHEEEVMRAADQIIDIGPDAGIHGGELMFQGVIDDMLTHSGSYTTDYLTGRTSIEVPKHRRKWNTFIEIKGARENNLKNIDVKFPLHTFTVVTGVSGSGKSTLVKKILFPSLQKIFGFSGEFTGKFDRIDGDIREVTQIEFVDQNPIGKSSRSNPVTYVKAYDIIRTLYAEQGLAKSRGYKPGHFSFNVDGGRCELCQGEGIVTVEMQFMADVHLICEACNGKRFKQEILEVKYNEKSISDVLDMTIEESLDFFKDKNKLIEKLQPLSDVGLGYVKLGQSSSSLSGGEAQRVKLASFLGKSPEDKNDHILFLFDEPTTGLHFHDIRKLLDSIQALINKGNSVIVIEHNMEMIKCADWIIDIGPEGGNGGGEVIFEGTPEQMLKCTKGHTARYLNEKLK
ncbi:excinuclease ABC subunit UvrA [uncultured Cytophaga sp.]|uniref:excinuclease ABC subunit UvrA n=1 Tax=uncultured Cytophaga sp. TaxID=160238 RepID=UPI002602FF11|nr:excinuclease ABC subunit UvrA [uncultured Cytophaga sp.]